MKSVKVILTKKGYLIPTSILNNEELKIIKKKLSFKPHLDERFNKKAESFSILRNQQDIKGNDVLIIPRFFKTPFKYEIVKDLLNNNLTNIEINFKGELKDCQKTVIDKTYDKLIKDYNMLYRLPCGFGKTVISIYILCKLKLRTFILVHKNELLEQWIDRLLFFTDIDKKDIGIIGGGKKQIDKNHKIILGMEQTLMMDNFDIKLLPLDIGLLICDECHHLGAEKFNKAIQKIQSKYFVSLSATPYRSDGLINVYKSFLGYNEYKQEREFTDDIYVNNIIFEFTKEELRKYNYIFNNSKMLQKTINVIVKNERRNKIIIDLINKNIRRKVLILSDRVNHINYLYETFINLNKNYKGNISRLFGKFKEDIKNCDILFASYQMAAEGLDVPQLDTLIMATPKSKVEQCCGRILRNSKGLDRYIYDIIDENIVYIKNFYYNSRIKFYIKSNYIINNTNSILNNKQEEQKTSNIQDIEEE